MSSAGLYKGFSFHEFVRTRNFTLTDREAVKMDILNHIYTMKGSRYRMSWFGTNLVGVTFDQLDMDLVDIIKHDIATVVEYDPRVQLISIKALPDFDRSSLTIELDIKYIELNMQEIVYLNIDFENR